MPRPSEKNLEIRDARREEILRAAARVFAARGFHEAKISEIAKAAALSHGLVYHYFESKEALVEAIFERKLDRMQEVHRAAFAGEGPVLDRLARACEQILAQTAREPDVSLFWTQSLVNRTLPEKVRRRFLRHAKRSFAELIAMIEEGQRAGEIADDVPAESLATALAALMRGLSHFQEVRITKARRAPPPADVIVRLLRPLGGSARARPHRSPEVA